MTFCTVINCMDGRVQLPVIEFVKKRFNADFVDSITEAGPNLILAGNGSQSEIHSILKRLAISVEEHGSVGIAIAGHHDCAGNPSDKESQLKHLKHAVKFVKYHRKNVEVIALWVDEKHEVHEVET